MSESRKFTVHPQIIYSLIQGQAGSLAKALLECVMNSVDAKATKLIIELTRDTIKIVDNGHGFRTRKEIEECFEVFGFPHEEGARTYGQFGIGRAQLWAFCSTMWRTNTFTMDVDIKGRGLDYDLKENQPKTKGLTIEAKLYNKLTTLDISVTKKELTDMAMYAQIPVILNGVQINKDPAKEKWDFDTEDAWIRLNENSTHLTVYNLGVLVQRIYAGYTGMGGLVITKPGVRLDLNMARNEVLEASCKVWARIKPFIQKQSDEKVRTKRTKVTDVELENRAQRLISGELTIKDVSELKLFTDITNRGHTLTQFLTQGRGGAFPVITLAENESRLGETAHTSKNAFVMHPKTLERFGVETLDEFKEKLFQLLEPQKQNQYIRRFCENAVFEADLAKAAPNIRDGHMPVANKDVTRKEKAVLYALRHVDYEMRSLVREVGASDTVLAARAYKVGVSETSLAWTDGRNIITFDRDSLAYADKGLGGMLQLMTLVAHEYLHDRETAGTHLHDETFYKRFHDVMLQSAKIGKIAFKAYRIYLSGLARIGLKPSKELLKDLTEVEEAAALVDAAAAADEAAEAANDAQATATAA